MEPDWRSACWRLTETIRSLSTRCLSARSFTGFSTSEATKMRHTDDDIERAAERFEQLPDQLDPASVDVDHTDDLRQVAAFSEAIRADQAG